VWEDYLIGKIICVGRLFDRKDYLRKKITSYF
jgi:hypothetical protein